MYGAYLCASRRVRIDENVRFFYGYHFWRESFLTFVVDIKPFKSLVEVSQNLYHIDYESLNHMFLNGYIIAFEEQCIFLIDEGPA